MPRRLLVLMCLVGAACGTDETPPPLPVEGAPPAAAPATSEEESSAPVVVFLGTSLTAGLGLADPEDGYVARLAEMADSAGLPIRAVNAGVSGETSAGGLRRLDWVLRQPLDVLFLELGANDGLRGQDPLSTADNLRTIIERTRTRYPESRVVIAGMEAPTNLGAFYTDLFREIFTSVAEDGNAVLVPFLLDGVAGVPELNQSDGIHPTPEGHDIMARNAWPYLEPVLRQWTDAHRAESGSGGSS